MAKKVKRVKKKAGRRKLKEEIKKELKKELRLKRRKPLLVRFIGFVIRFAVITIIILLVSLTLVAGAAFLAYNFLPLKTITFCVSNETHVSSIPCASGKDCVESITEITEVSSKTISETTGIEAGVVEGISLIGGFLGFMFKEIGSCNEDGLCEIKKVRGIEQIIGGEAVECAENEERREKKITLKTLDQPDKAVKIIKEAIESEEIRDIIMEVIKTRKLPEFDNEK